MRDKKIKNRMRDNEMHQLPQMRKVFFPTEMWLFSEIRITDVTEREKYCLRNTSLCSQAIKLQTNLNKCAFFMFANSFPKNHSITLSTRNIKSLSRRKLNRQRIHEWAERYWRTMRTKSYCFVFFTQHHLLISIHIGINTEQWLEWRRKHIWKTWRVCSTVPKPVFLRMSQLFQTRDRFLVNTLDLINPWKLISSVLLGNSRPNY